LAAMATATAAVTMATIATTATMATTASVATFLVTTTTMAMKLAMMKMMAMTTMTQQWHRAPKKNHKKQLCRMFASARAVVQGCPNQVHVSLSMVWG
jgi:hypothetical protein